MVLSLDVLRGPHETVRSPAANAVRIEDVERTFEMADGASRRVLNRVDLEISAGEIVAIVGPSGCGKSTLLRLIGGLDHPTAGGITLDGMDVSDIDERTAIAFQEPRLLPWRTLAHNVELGLPRRYPRRDRADRVRGLLDLVGLSHAADQRPREVSGGMAQRASLARALARNPGVLLLDEPFGALDALTRLRMQDLLLEIHRAEPTTIVLVTHDVEEALYLADRVLLLRSLVTETDGDSASIVRSVPVPGMRPRDRADRTLADLRADLLEGLGVDTHHYPHSEEHS